MCSLSLENMYMVWLKLENRISRALFHTALWTGEIVFGPGCPSFVSRSWWRNMNLLSKWGKQLPLVPAISWLQQVWSPSTSTWCKGATFHMLSSWLRYICPWLRCFLWFYVQLSHQSIPPCQRPRRIGNNFPSSCYLWASCLPWLCLHPTRHISILRWLSSNFASKGMWPSSFSPAVPLASNNFPGYKWWFWALWS